MIILILFHKGIWNFEDSSFLCWMVTGVLVKISVGVIRFSVTRCLSLPSQNGSTPFVSLSIVKRMRGWILFKIIMQVIKFEEPEVLNTMSGYYPKLHKKGHDCTLQSTGRQLSLKPRSLQAVTNQSERSSRYRYYSSLELVDTGHEKIHWLK